MQRTETIFWRYNNKKQRFFQCVCQARYREIKTQLKVKKEKEASFHEGRKLAEEQFIRSRSKQKNSLLGLGRKDLSY